MPHGLQTFYSCLGYASTPLGAVSEWLLVHVLQVRPFALSLQLAQGDGLQLFRMAPAFATFRNCRQFIYSCSDDDMEGLCHMGMAISYILRHFTSLEYLKLNMQAGSRRYVLVVNVMHRAQQATEGCKPLK